VLVLPVVVPEPPVVVPPPEDPDPDPVEPDDPPVLDPLPELDDPAPLLPVDPPPGLLPFDPVPDPVPSPSTDAIFPPHAIAKKIAANENAFEDFKTNLFLERNRFCFSIEPSYA
jgi:hypothetical protein